MAFLKVLIFATVLGLALSKPYSEKQLLDELQSLLEKRASLISYGGDGPKDNLCGNNPCKNGGECVDNNYYYTCSCLEGFGGGDCEIDTNIPAVENLELVAASASKIEFKFSPVDGAETYDIEYMGRPATGSDYIRHKDCDTTESFIDGLVEGERYVISVKAKAGGNFGKSGPSLVVKATASANDKRSTLNGGSYSHGDQCANDPCLGGTCTSYSYYYMCTCDRGYSGADCEIMDSIGKVSDLQVIGLSGTSNSAEVTLSFYPVHSATSYTVRLIRKPINYYEYAEIDEFLTFSTYITINSLTPGHTYIAMVKAMQGEFSGDYSDHVTFNV